jgi:poly [ADP-ribose] polymerase 2/3/4
MAGALIDENCPLRGAQIYGDYSCTLNNVNIAKNENKFYLMQLLLLNGHAHVWKRWGRVGMIGQSKQIGPQCVEYAVNEFERTFEEKTGVRWSDRATRAPVDGHYAFMRLDVANTSTGGHTSGQVALSGVARAPLPTTDPHLEPRVCAIVRELCDERMMSNAMAVTYNIDVRKLPLGKLNAAQLDDAERVLKEIEDAVRPPSQPSQDALSRLSSRFWTLVPQASKLNQRLPIIDSMAHVQRLADTLDGLRNIQAASAGLQRSTTLHDLYRSLDVELEPCLPEEMQVLSAMLTGTVSDRHGGGIELVEAMVLRKPSQDARDFQHTFEALQDHRMLFHGSRTSNFMGILTEGLRVPRQDQVSNGSTLGLGCYFADCSTKSLQYCCLNKGACGYMVVSEVALGTKHVVQGCCQDRIQLQFFQSRLARGTLTVDYVEHDGVWFPRGPVRPKRDTSFSTFIHNEAMIVDANQYRFRYLLKVKSV